MADYTRFKLRGDVKADWLNANPVLALNEPALETDTKRFKIGDGVSTYSALPYGRNTNEYASLYNVSMLFPLSSGFYTHTTAITAIPTAERIKGLIISYETSAGMWYTEQYTGTDVSGWATLANWSKVPGASDFSEMEAELAQLYSDLNETNLDIQSVKGGNLNDSVIGLGKLTPEALAYIGAGGTVTNLADGEDLENVEIGGVNVVREKTIKLYDAPSYSGLGRIILRKNMVGGVNTLTQSMLSHANTYYYVNFSFVITEDIVIPSNCVLDLKGNTISGTGSIRVGNTNTIIKNGVFESLLYVGESLVNTNIRSKWWTFDYGIRVENITFVNAITKSVQEDDIANYMNGLTDAVLEDNSYCAVIFQNVIGATLTNCTFVNVPVGIKYVTSNVNQCVSRINILSNKIKHSYCCMYADGDRITNPDFGDTTFSCNEIYAYKYCVNITSIDGFLANGNTAYCLRVLDSICVSFKSGININLNGNQIFGGLVGVAFDQGNLPNNNVIINGNEIINQGKDREDVFNETFGILLNGLSGGFFTINGNSFNAENVYKYIGIKNSTISSITSTSNQYNFRPFGWFNSANEDILNCYYNPFLVYNSIILAIEADVFWNKTIEFDDNWRSNFYSLNQKYELNKLECVKGRTINIEKTKFNNEVILIFDIKATSHVIITSTLKWRAVVGAHYIEYDSITELTILQFYQNLVASLSSFDDVVMFDDLTDNGVLYIKCSHGFRVIEGDIRPTAIVLSGGLNMDYRNTANVNVKNAYEMRPVDSTITVGRYQYQRMSDDSSLQDRKITINSAFTGTANFIFYRKELFMFVLHQSTSTENSIAKITSIINSGVFPAVSIDGSVITLNKEYLNGFGTIYNNLFSLNEATQKASSLTLKSFFQYDTLVKEMDSSVNIGQYVIDTSLNKPVFNKGDKYIDAEGNLYNSKRIGITSSRPTDVRPGFVYFDTTLNKPIFWNSINWVDYAGVVV